MSESWIALPLAWILVAALINVLCIQRIEDKIDRILKGLEAKKLVDGGGSNE